MTEILGTPNLSKRVANFMAHTGLFDKLGRACLVDTEQTLSKPKKTWMLELNHGFE